MNILVTLDSNYVMPLTVLLKSLMITNPQNEFDIYVAHSSLTKDDFETAIILADAVSTSIKPLYSFLDYAEHTELNKDGNIATKYQKDLIPQKLPVIPNISIGCFSNAMENVCGDYYDVIPSRKDRISFIIIKK